MQTIQDDGFSAIWLYWVKKYMKNKQKASQTLLQSLNQLKKHYSIQAVDCQSLDSKKAVIRAQKSNLQWPLYVVDPEKQLRQMQKVLQGEDDSYKQQLFSYYLNIKNVFIIYSNDWEGSQHLSSLGGQETMRDNVSQGNKQFPILRRIRDNRTQGNSRPQMYSSFILKSSSFKDESSECHNQSIYEAPHHKIQDLQVLDKMTQIQGMQIWNCKYKHIPHSYIKLKNQTWKRCLSLPLSHPAQPKLINQHPLCCKLQLLRPGVDKLLPFVSYLKVLQKYFPGFTPEIGSIFQMNGLPVVFSRQDDGGWSDQTNIGVLCYYVVFGSQRTMTAAQVQKWSQKHPKTLLSKTIKELTKRQRQKKRGRIEVESKGLLIFDQDAHIW